MHQDAFPGEDISDRPLPESVVPAFRRLISERMPSGRYRAADLMPAGDQAADDQAGGDRAGEGRAGEAPVAEPVLGGPGRP